MVEEKDLVERIQEAKDIIGDDAIPIIAEHLGITVEDGRASCPFHQDDTPSFIWNPKLKYFKCFSCSRVYSILDYFVDITGSTKEAINELFKMAHMEYDTYSYKPFEGDRIDWFKDYKYPHPEKEPTEDNVIKYLGYRAIHCYVSELNASSLGKLIVHFDPGSQIQFLSTYSICRKQFIEVYYWEKHSPLYGNDPFYKEKSDKITIHSPYLNLFAGENTIHIFTCNTENYNKLSTATLIYFIATCE